MSEQHTPEPWLVSKRTVFALNERGTNIFSAIVQDAHTSTEELEANARRIVACVNACAGISTVELDMDNSMFIAALREKRELRKQRDELLAALEEAAFRAAHGECAHVQLVCDTAIASVKGGA